MNDSIRPVSNKRHKPPPKLNLRYMLHKHEIEQDIQNIQSQASTSVNKKGIGNYFMC